MARSVGAVTAALVNVTDSPLAAAADIVLPIEAGPEVSVAATKTVVASLSALLRLTASWLDDAALAASIEGMPARLAAATDLDWGAALPTLAEAPSLVTIGRGPTLAIAREASLKLKETCHLHAEAFSGAEFLHGPVTLVSPRYPVVMFMPTDAARAGMTALLSELRQKTSALFVTGASSAGPGHLPALDPDHPETDAVCLLQSFYGLALRLAAERGLDVDRPRHLKKVTRTR
jgi:glucosamine--fructose-6-phosphate aminotransferase (isomerizing)